MKAIYQAVAQFNGRDAGHVAWGATKAACRAAVSAKRPAPQLSCRYTRVLVTPEQYAAQVIADATRS